MRTFPEPALLVDLAGTVLEANDLAAALLGCDAPNPSQIELALALPGALGLLERLEGSAPASARLQTRRPNGVPVLLDVTARRCDDGGVRRAMLVLRELDRERLMTEAQRHFDAAFDTAPIGMALFNPDGEYVRVNQALCRMLGRDEDDLLGRRDQELTHADDRAGDVEAAWRILNGELSTWQCEKRFVHADGSIVWVIANLTFLRDDDGRALSWVGQFQDITAQKRLADVLRESEERFRQALDHAPIGMAMVGVDGRFLRVNNALCELVGHSEDALLRTTFQAVTHPDDLDDDLELLRELLEGERRSYQLEKRYWHARGHIVWVSISVSAVRDGEGRPLYVISQVQDVTQRRDADARLRHLADRDSLTGLFNRRRFEDELDRHLARCRRYGFQGSLLLADLDHFKLINDTLGHKAGDDVLRHTAGVLGRRLRETDALARYGGDEFAILLPESDEPAARLVADQLAAALSAQRVEIAGTPLELRASIGVIALGAGSATVEQALLDADRAMYRVKAAQRGAPRYAEPSGLPRAR